MRRLLPREAPRNGNRVRDYPVGLIFDDLRPRPSRLPRLRSRLLDPTACRNARHSTLSGEQKNLIPKMTTPSAPATHEQITRRAFQIWQANGRRPGTAGDDWRAAERELAREREHRDLNDAQDKQDAMD